MPFFLIFLIFQSLLRPPPNIIFLSGDRGFSIGVDDVTPSDRMTKIKNKLVIEGQRLADEEIQAYTSGAYVYVRVLEVKKTKERERK